MSSNSRVMLMMFGSSMVPSTPEWLARICSMSVDPERGRPTMKIDRKSTRLNSSHSQISYAVFCLKKKNKDYTNQQAFGSLGTVDELNYPIPRVITTRDTVVG